MPSTFKTPGVYIQEISKFPPSVAEVETAIPAFIGYTEKAVVKGIDLYAVEPSDEEPVTEETTNAEEANNVEAAPPDLAAAITQVQEALAAAQEALDSQDDGTADLDPVDAAKKALDNAKAALNSAQGEKELGKQVDDVKTALEAAVGALENAEISSEEREQLTNAKAALDGLLSSQSKSGVSKPASTGSADVEPVVIRITSLLEYEQFFGGAMPETGISVTVTETGEVSAKIDNPSPHNMFYSLQAYFANGGGPCYIVSVGKTPSLVSQGALDAGLQAVAKEDEVTLIVFPESLSLIDLKALKSADDDTKGGIYADYKSLYDAALAQCESLQDRFVVMDALLDTKGISIFDAADDFRSYGISTNSLKYGAAYGPRLETIFDYAYDESAVKVSIVVKLPLNVDGTPPDPPTSTENTNLKAINPTETASNKYGEYYPLVKRAVNAIPVVLPAAPLVVGVYAMVDSTRGVWKAPANVSLSSVIGPTIKISSDEQENLNIDTTGKSINAIRAFTGKGTLIWGARTLAGNDNEWRYVPVRRFFNMAEESIKKATEQFVFEPNDANTWTKVQAMIENFLILQWRAGALAGAKPEQAFYVKIGLNQTMTALDILEGRMIVEIGMAVVRPAEFIILKFSHKMQES